MKSSEQVLKDTKEVIARLRRGEYAEWHIENCGHGNFRMTNWWHDRDGNVLEPCNGVMQNLPKNEPKPKTQSFRKRRGGMYEQVPTKVSLWKRILLRFKRRTVQEICPSSGDSSSS